MREREKSCVSPPAESISIDRLKEWGAGEAIASALLEQIHTCWQPDAFDWWMAVVEQVLTPQHPHSLHRNLHRHIFSEWDTIKEGPPPVWRATPQQIRQTNIYSLMQELGFSSYAEFHSWTVRERLSYWEKMVEKLGIVFKRAPLSIARIDDVRSPVWFPGAQMNIAESCFRGDGDALAIIEYSERHGWRRLPLAYLHHLARRIAGSLAEMGVKPGTPVGICMPMTAESVAIYLGLVWAGCVVVSIADSLSPEEIGKRLRIAGTELVFTQDVIVRKGREIPLLERVLAAGARQAVVIREGNAALPAQAVVWDKFLKNSSAPTPHYASPMDTINVLFSSGTTGEPKAIPWNHTTPIKCAADGFIHHDIKHGDVVAWPTNIGWMMGPWLIFASLINRAAIALYVGTPTEGGFCEFVEQAGVTMLGLVPTIVRAWRASGATNGVDWSRLRMFSSTGEASNEDDYFWLMSRARGYRPVVEYCGGTEIGGGYITGVLTQPFSPATFNAVAAGLDIVILDDEGRQVPQGRIGELFVVPPSVGLSVTLFNRDHHAEYFEGTPHPAPDMKGAYGVPLAEQTKGWQLRLRRHGDEMEQVVGALYRWRAHGRADDTMNLSGIKVSSAEIERAVMLSEVVAEVAAIAVPPPGGGPERLILYIVPREEVSLQKLKQMAQEKISKHLSPLFRVWEVVVVDALPRTPTNKVMRRLLRARYIQTEQQRQAQ